MSWYNPATQQRVMPGGYTPPRQGPGFKPAAQVKKKQPTFNTWTNPRTGQIAHRPGTPGAPPRPNKPVAPAAPAPGMPRPVAPTAPAPKPAKPQIPIFDALYDEQVAANNANMQLNPQMLAAQQFAHQWGSQFNKDAQGNYTTAKPGSVYAMEEGKINRGWNQAYGSGTAGLYARGMGRSGGVDNLATETAEGRAKSLYDYSQDFGIPAITKNQATIDLFKLNLDRVNAAAKTSAAERKRAKQAVPQMAGGGKKNSWFTYKGHSYSKAKFKMVNGKPVRR